MTAVTIEQPFFLIMVTLKKLTYQGFRGQSREIDFSDGTTVISSRNGGGKTTVLNAFIFLLSGYDTDNKANFNLFDDRETYTPQNIGYVSVTGEFDTDGVRLSLTRKAHHAWKMSDSEELVRGNDVYEYFIDGISVSATKYKSEVESIFGKGEPLKYMINVGYYRLMDDWKDLRKALAGMAGEITMSDMKGDYTSIADALKRKDPESLRKSYMARLNELEESKKTHETQIKTHVESMPRLSDIEDAENEVAKLENERSSIEERMKSLVGRNDSYVEKRKEEEDAISKKRREMEEARDKHNREHDDKVRICEKALSDAKESNRTMASRRASLRNSIESEKTLIASLENILQNLREENLRIKNRVFDNKCPVCGQDFVGSTREEKIASFNERKQADLSANIDMGKAQKRKLEDAQAQVAAYEAELAGIKEVDITGLEKSLYDTKKSFVPFDDSAYMSEIRKMEEERTEIPGVDETESMQLRIGDINTRLKEIMDNCPRRSDIDKARKTIDRLNGELTQINTEMVENRRLKAKVEAYLREYADIIKNRVNVNFDKVNVVMTQYNKSGALVDCCSLEYEGVTGSNNYASRILIGVELSQAFQKHYGVTLPIFIDNAESLNEVNIPKHDGQVILLVVSEDDFKVE